MGFSLPKQESAGTQEETAIMIHNRGLELEASSWMDSNIDTDRMNMQMYSK